jgi:hypothetical protein
MCLPSSLLTPDPRHPRPRSVAFHPDTRTYDPVNGLINEDAKKTPYKHDAVPRRFRLVPACITSRLSNDQFQVLQVSGVLQRTFCYEFIRPSRFSIRGSAPNLHRCLSGTASLDDKRRPGRASQHGPRLRIHSQRPYGTTEVSTGRRISACIPLCSVRLSLVPRSHSLSCARPTCCSSHTWGSCIPVSWDRLRAVED